MHVIQNVNQQDRVAYRVESELATCVIDIDDQASLQLFTVDCGKESLNVTTEIKNDEFRVTLSVNEREVFSGLVDDLVKALEATNALNALKFYFRS